MDPATLRHLWHHLESSFTVAGHQPSRTLVLVTGLLAVAAVASRRVWPVSRTVVTMAHEGGHALVALLTGRRLAGVRLFHNAAGVTVSAGYSGGPAVVFTALAGYLSAPLLGLGAAALLATGHLLSVLLLLLAGLVGLAIAMRNAYGFLAVFVTGAAIVAVVWQGSLLTFDCWWRVVTLHQRLITEVFRQGHIRPAPRAPGRVPRSGALAKSGERGAERRWRPSSW